MATYRMSDGKTIVRTENATESWREARDFNGSNHIGRSSGSQWRHETLHRSRKGRYYVETESHVQGTQDSAEWISNEEAVRWLLLNDYELPDELKPLEEAVTE